MGGGGAETVEGEAWNFSRVIIPIKAFLMQNLKLVALPVLEKSRHKVSLEKREWLIKFGYLPPENGFKFQKVSFYAESFFST